MRTFLLAYSHSVDWLKYTIRSVRSVTYLLFRTPVQTRHSRYRLYTLTSDAAPYSHTKFTVIGVDFSCFVADKSLACVPDTALVGNIPVSIELQRTNENDWLNAGCIENCMSSFKRLIQSAVFAGVDLGTSPIAGPPLTKQPQRVR